VVKLSQIIVTISVLLIQLQTALAQTFPTRSPAQQAPRQTPESPRPAREPLGGFLGIERITYDLGASTGQFLGRSYTEATLGVNLYFNEYFAWRNAGFARFVQDRENVYGLDSSARGVFSAAGSGLGFTVFGGPGYRFVNRGDHAPFAEAGLVLRAGGLSVGGGVKTLMNSWVRSGAENDTQYFLILAGGGTL
jgi:hypothetical protein